MKNSRFKFRAWDKLTNEITKMFMIYSTGKVLNDSGWDEIFAGGDFTDRLIVMQYTGKNDENNAEIYEGDIVEFWTNAWAGGEAKRIGRINYHYGAYVICNNLNDDSFNRTMIEPYQYRVIGNVYESPELLQ